MTTEITFRPGTEGLMAALSAAEKLTSASPAVPTSLALSHNEFDYAPGTYDRPIGVVIYFHFSPESVREFADTFDAEVKEKPHTGEWNLYTYADGSLDGVPFRAWTLTNAQAAVENSSAVAA